MLSRTFIGIFAELLLLLIIISNVSAGVNAYKECSAGKEFQGFTDYATRLEKIVGYIGGYYGSKIGCFLGEEVDDGQ